MDCTMHNLLIVIEGDKERHLVEYSKLYRNWAQNWFDKLIQKWSKKQNCSMANELQSKLSECIERFLYSFKFCIYLNRICTQMFHIKFCVKYNWTFECFLRMHITFFKHMLSVNCWYNAQQSYLSIELCMNFLATFFI